MVTDITIIANMIIQCIVHIKLAVTRECFHGAIFATNQNIYSKTRCDLQTNYSKGDYGFHADV